MIKMYLYKIKMNIYYHSLKKEKFDVKNS